jgi:hypothetical protein
MLTTHPHLVPRSRMSRSYTPLPPNTTMACSWTALLCFALLLRQSYCIHTSYACDIYFSALTVITHIRYWYKIAVSCGPLHCGSLGQIAPFPPPPTGGRNIVPLSSYLYSFMLWLFLLPRAQNSALKGTFMIYKLICSASFLKEALYKTSLGSYRD